MVTITTLVKENKGRFIAFDKKKYAEEKKSTNLFQKIEIKQPNTI